MTDERETEPNLPVIVLGGGGHAKVLICALLLQGRRILGYTDLRADCTSVSGIPRLGDDRILSAHEPETVRLVNGVGSVGATTLRMQIYERLQRKGYRFATVVHPSAVIAPDVRLGEGVQIMAGTVVQPGSRVGANAVLNTGAVVDHDCAIEAHVHIAPGAVLSGSVHIGEGAHVGTGAVIIQGVTIGERSIVGAGTVVVHDVPRDVTVVGVPGKVIRRNEAK